MLTISKRYPNRRKVHLKIGEGLVLDKPTIVTTVLGSCVSVTFHCPEKKIGAIFHALMPIMPEKEEPQWRKNNYRYVNSSIRHIIQALHRKGVKNQHIEAKVFGGAQAITQGINKPGPTNIKIAFEILTELNIKILASDVGGKNGRNLVFISDTGEVFIKTHRKNILDNLRN